MNSSEIAINTIFINAINFYIHHTIHISFCLVCSFSIALLQLNVKHQIRSSHEVCWHRVREVPEFKITVETSISVSFSVQI
jgi:hypothetical protein